LAEEQSQNSATMKLLTTHNKDLNTFLGGGIRKAQITEITGQSASGKTLFCWEVMDAYLRANEE
jgi:RecA/RadA recombinase